MAIDRTDTLRTAGEAAALATRLAEDAADAGTFGVGGFLLGPDGSVLKAARNQVFIAGRLDDPTAHVERQLVDWYFANRDRRRLPAPAECTIVSSLDPCMQCAGAILIGGFNAVHICDDPTAGVHSRPALAALPAPLRAGAAASFQQFQVRGAGGAAAERPGWWPLDWEPIDRSVHDRAQAAFSQSLMAIQAAVAGGPPPVRSNNRLAPDEDLRTPTQTAPIELPTHKSLPAAVDFLLRLQLDAMVATGSTDAALFYAHGYGTIAAALGQTHLSPIRIALLELLRKYSRLRQADASRGCALPHPRDLLLITTFGPSASAAGVMMVGSYGSAMEGPLPEPRDQRWWYLVAGQSEGDMLSMIEEFPPLYQSIIGVRPLPIPPGYLERHSAAPAGRRPLVA